MRVGKEESKKEKEKETHTHTTREIERRIHVCDMTHQCVRHDSFTRVTCV